jgi:predicted nucleotidyltransferase
MVGLDSKLGLKVLAHFFSNPSQKLHLRDIAARLKADPANLSREMKRLSQAGLFVVEPLGRLKLYSLNPTYPLYKEISSIIFKTEGVEGALRTTMKDLKGVSASCLFGSFAAGKEDAHSDIDLLIVGSPNMERVGDHILDLEKKLGRPIQYRIFSQEEFDRRKISNDPFIKDVLSHPIILLSGEL